MKKILAGLSTAAAVIGTPLVAFAQVVDVPDTTGLARLLQPIMPTNQNFTIAGLFYTVFNFIILIAGIIAILYLIWAGIQYITASTDEDKAKKAKTAIFNAIIGIVVIILSYAIIFYVGGLTRGAVGQIEGTGGINGGGFGAPGGLNLQ